MEIVYCKCPSKYLYTAVTQSRYKGISSVQYLQMAVSCDLRMTVT